MHTPAIVAEVLAIGAVITVIGVLLVERGFPPRGRFVDIDGLRQHVVELGTDNGRPPIVLLHGAGCNIEDMRLALGEKFAARHRVILIDRAGLGWSERAGVNGSSPAYQAAMLRAVLDRLDVERAVVVGHSWGGALALTFALDYPERVAALALLAPPLYPLLRRMTLLYTILATPLAGWVFARTLALPFGALFMAPGIAGAFLPQRAPRNYIVRTGLLLLLRPACFLANARDIADLAANLAPQTARYPALTPPTVIITGDRDRVVAADDHAVPFAQAARGAKLVLLPGIGHMLHHAAAERVVTEIENLMLSAT
jgi:pimeloyl-ACP methyl ester carboxylesterase